MKKFLEKKLKYLRGESKEDPELPLKLKSKDINSIQEALKEELILQFRGKCEEGDKPPESIQYKDFFIGRPEFTESEKRDLEKWKKNHYINPSEFGAYSVYIAIKDKKKPSIKLSFDSISSEDIEDEDESEEETPKSDNNFNFLGEDEEDDEEHDLDEVEKLRLKQNTTIKRSVVPSSIVPTLSGALSYYTEGDKRLVKTLINSSKLWLNRELTADEIEDYKFLRKVEPLIKYYTENYTIGYLIKILSLVLKNYVFYLRREKKRYQALKTEPEKTFKELYDDYFIIKKQLQKLILIEKEKEDSEILTQKQLDEWISMEKLKELGKIWESRFDKEHEKDYLFYALFCLIHAYGALRTSFYYDLKIYTSQDELEEVAKKEWMEDYKK